MDFQSLLYDPIYTVISVDAKIIIGGTAHIVSALDKTTGIDTGDEVHGQTILPAIVVRARDLFAHEIRFSDLAQRGNLVVVAGQWWNIVTYRLRPSPAGERDGEVYILLSRISTLDLLADAALDPIIRDEGVLNLSIDIFWNLKPSDIDPIIRDDAQLDAAISIFFNFSATFTDDAVLAVELDDNLIPTTLRDEATLDARMFLGFGADFTDDSTLFAGVYLSPLFASITDDSTLTASFVLYLSAALTDQSTLATDASDFGLMLSASIADDLGISKATVTIPVAVGNGSTTGTLVPNGAAISTGGVRFIGLAKGSNTEAWDTATALAGPFTKHAASFGTTNTNTRAKVAYSPSLNRFVYVNGNLGGVDGGSNSGIWTAPGDGSSITALITGGIQWPDAIWSPTLNKFVFASSNGVATSNDGNTNLQQFSLGAEVCCLVDTGAEVIAFGLNQLWRSTDGITWTKFANVFANSNAQASCACLITTGPDAGKVFVAAWRSANTLTQWFRSTNAQHTVYENISNYGSHHSSCVYNSRRGILFVVGSEGNSSGYETRWMQADGAQGLLSVANPGFPPNDTVGVPSIDANAGVWADGDNFVMGKAGAVHYF